MTPLPRNSLAESIADFLRMEFLRSAAYPAGSFVREEELARQLKTSRAPVREAMKILEGEGLLQIIPRRGAQIRAFSGDDIEELYEIRFLLETRVAERIIEHGLMDAEDFALLEDLLRETLAILASSRSQDEKLMEFCRRDRAFHKYIAQKSGPCISGSLATIYGQLLQAISEDVLAKGLEAVTKEHFKIIDAFQRNDLETLKTNRHFSYFAQRATARKKK